MKPLSLEEKPYPDQDVMIVGQSWVSLTTTVAFVPVERIENQYRYVKTHPCVVLVECPACKAPPGTLCRFRYSLRGCTSCHADRKIAWEVHQKGQTRRIQPGVGAAARRKVREARK